MDVINADPEVPIQAFSYLSEVGARVLLNLGGKKTFGQSKLGKLDAV